jgi:hypothetical protein
MATLNEIYSRVRTERLFSPRPQQPPLHMILGAVLTPTRNLYNELNNTDKNWAVGSEIPLQVEPNKDTYQLAVGPDFGKVLSVSDFGFPFPPNFCRIKIWRLGRNSSGLSLRQKL